jgi:hypothetical protein
MYPVVLAVAGISEGICWCHHPIEDLVHLLLDTFDFSKWFPTDNRHIFDLQ